GLHRRPGRQSSLPAPAQGRHGGMSASRSMPKLFAKLLDGAGLPPLGPGPRAGVRAQAELDRELAAMPQLAALPAERRELVRALVLLWHDHLEAAHTISQGIETADGAFVHGIMHRREPDYGNAKYWFRRVGRHPVFPSLAGR